jgi:hypothetical protein
MGKKELEKRPLEFKNLRVGMIIIAKGPNPPSAKASRYLELLLVIRKNRYECEGKVLTTHFWTYLIREYISDDMDFYTNPKAQKSIEISRFDEMYFISKKDLNTFLLRFIAYNIKKCSKLNEEEIIKTTVHSSELLPKNFTRKELLKRIGESS